MPSIPDLNQYGEQTRILADMLRRQGLPPGRVVDLGGLAAGPLWTRLTELTPDGGVIVGVGNIALVGRDLLALLAQMEVAS